MEGYQPRIGIAPNGSIIPCLVVLSIGSPRLGSMTLEPFAARLRTLRIQHNLTQIELAQELGLARHGYISNLEAARKFPSLDLVVRIADRFGVTTDYLLLGRPSQPLLSSNTVPTLNSSSDIPPLFGSKLRHLRLQRQMRQTILAHELGLARHGYVSNLETGRKEPSLNLVVRVAEFFEVSTDYLLRDTIPVGVIRKPEQHDTNM